MRPSVLLKQPMNFIKSMSSWIRVSTGSAATEVAQVSTPDTAKAQRMMKPASITIEWSKKGELLNTVS